MVMRNDCDDGDDDDNDYDDVGDDDRVLIPTVSTMLPVNKILVIAIVRVR